MARTIGIPKGAEQCGAQCCQRRGASGAALATLLFRKADQQLLHDPFGLGLAEEAVPGRHRGSRAAAVDGGNQGICRPFAQRRGRQGRPEAALQRHAVARAAVLTDEVNQRLLALGRRGRERGDGLGDGQRSSDEKEKGEGWKRGHDAGIGQVGVKVESGSGRWRGESAPSGRSAAKWRPRGRFYPKTRLRASASVPNLLSARRFAPGAGTPHNARLLRQRMPVERGGRKWIFGRVRQ